MLEVAYTRTGVTTRTHEQVMQMEVVVALTLAFGEQVLD